MRTFRIGSRTLHLMSLVMGLVECQNLSAAWADAKGLFGGRAIQVEGRISSAVLGISGATAFESTRRFRLHTDGVRYLARFEKPNENFETDYVEQAFDGKNTYYITTMPTWVDAQRKSGASVGENVGDASLTSIPVPQNPFADSCGILWCAFLAGERLRIEKVSSGASYYTPFVRGTKPVGGDYTENEFPIFSMKWEDSAESARFLSKLVIVNERWGQDVPGESSAGMAYTNAVFRTLEWQTMGATRLPQISEAQVFAVSGDGVIRMKLKYRMTAESISYSDTAVSFVPALPGLTSVREERFNSPKYNGDFHFQYFITNSWLTKAQVEKIDQFKVAATNANVPTTRTSPLLITLLVVILIVGPVAYLRMRSPKGIR